MGNIRVEATSASSGTLIEACYEAPDYRDAYLVGGPGIERVEDFATRFFLSQPKWLAKVSMNLGDKESRRSAIDGRDYPKGSAVGTWRVHERNDNEIVFGEHMGFMEYRFSFLLRSDGRIEASTAVRYLKRFGRFYFAIVKPFHIGFVKVALGNAATQKLEVAR